MVDEDYMDGGQSAFWENQEAVQAPPLEPEPPEKKKKRRLIVSGLILTVILLVITISLPRRAAISPLPSPTPEVSPTPIPLESEIVQQFSAIDQQLAQSSLDTIVAPPKIDMEVEF